MYLLYTENSEFILYRIHLALGRFRVDDSAAIHRTLQGWFKLVIDPVNRSWSTFNSERCDSKIASRSIRDIIRFAPTVLCAYLYSCLQQNRLFTLMSRKLSRKARSEHLKTFLSAWKARIKRARQQISRSWLLFLFLVSTISHVWQGKDVDRRWRVSDVGWG